MKTPRLVVFAKAPQAGLAKTRLIPALGAHGAARLARRLLEHALAQALASGVGPVELCMSPGPDDAAWAGVALPQGVLRTDQGAGDLGARMARAVRRVTSGAVDAPDASEPMVFEQGRAASCVSGEWLLLMGADCPALTAGVIAEAARQLARHDAVLVPVADGGYVLLGLRADAPALFGDMAWSTASVAAETLRRLSALGLSVWLGPLLHDIDEEADLRHLPQDWNISEQLTMPSCGRELWLLPPLGEGRDGGTLSARGQFLQGEPPPQPSPSGGGSRPASEAMT